MTDNEIIKALECCIIGDCNNCYYDEQTACNEYMKQDALDLINRTKLESKKYRGKCQNQKKELALKNEQIVRQRAEIERLTEESKKVSAYIGNGWGYVSFLEFVKNQRAEAIKEYLAKLSEKSFRLRHIDEMADGMVTTRVVDMNTIVKVAKEMDGADNG